ncbi:GNAT family N-acetyltransferase [Algicola sagamiensis]|uniref:GNAT family N-acetyltransferase n=1 Tax=Algicola sagamiensis TaxID=163869 RepID=UPI000382C051|nr:GNAT family N-acetyltransferase [Algicola sagamiensis]
MDLIIRPAFQASSYLNTVALWHYQQWGIASETPLSQYQSYFQQYFAVENTVPIMWLALAGGKVIGSVALQRDTLDEETGEILVLGGLYVTDEMRGQGIGAALLQIATDHAADIGTQTLYLATMEHVEYYQRFGWRIEKEVNKDNQPSQLMCLDFY